MKVDEGGFCVWLIAGSVYTVDVRDVLHPPPPPLPEVSYSIGTAPELSSLVDTAL